jgi:hypothetical protein
LSSVPLESFSLVIMVGWVRLTVRDKSNCKTNRHYAQSSDKCKGSGSAFLPITNDIEWHGITEHGTAEYDMAEHGMAEHGMAEHGMAEDGMSWHGMAEHGMAEHGMAWHGRA